jgi:hypothetical protein
MIACGKTGIEKFLGTSCSSMLNDKSQKVLFTGVYVE